MNRNLFLLFLLIQSNLLFSIESKAESVNYQVKDSLLFNIEALASANTNPQEPVRTIERDTVHISSMRFPNSTYKIAHGPGSLGHYFSFSINTVKFQDPLKHIKNINFKYLLGELEVEVKEKEDKSVDKAVSTLLDYVKNDSIRNMVNYLKDYIDKRQTEDALRKLAKKVEFEDEKIQQDTSLSINEKFELEDDAKKYSELYNYVEGDNVHQWIREISRDSVSFAIRNGMNDSLAFWINNGKNDFKRFWLKKASAILLVFGYKIQRVKVFVFYTMTMFIRNQLKTKNVGVLKSS